MNPKGYVWIALVLALAGLFGLIPQAHADSSPGVCVLDVTPGSFDVLWQAAPNGTPSLTVYTDRAGTQEAGPEISVRPFPLNGGDSSASDSYQAVVKRRELVDHAISLGLYKFRVSGLTPGASCFFKARISYDVGDDLVYPASGTRGVTTPKEASFLSDAPLLNVELDNPQGSLQAGGYVVSALCPETMHGVSSFVGDGAITNTACLNLGNAFSKGGGNWAPDTQKDLILVVLRGADGPPVWASATMQFGQSFAVASSQALELETSESGTQLYEAGLAMRVLVNQLDHPCACSISDAGMDGTIRQWDVLDLLQQAAGY